MIPENIRKLLDSMDENDNKIGWELVDAQGVSHKDVIEYVNNTKVPTNWVTKFRWDGSKYVRNDKEYNKVSSQKFIAETQYKYDMLKQKMGR